MKKIIRLLFHRVTFIVLFMLIQLFVLVGVMLRFSDYFAVFYSISILLSALIALSIINSRDNPAYKMAWIIPVLLMPVFGGMLYLMFGHSGLTRREKQRMADTLHRVQKAALPGDVSRLLEQRSPTAASQSRYIHGYADCPPSQNTATQYYPLGENAFAAMKEAMESAQCYIFLEYFIIQPGIMWDSILEILCRKAAEGLDVRLIYDDMGCMFTLPFRYDRKLQQMGIRCCVFNPFRPVLSSRFNNRNHCKMTVVDGHTAFTGGINLADEYINAFEKHGHWKDTVLRVQGDAAWYMTAMFLSMWDWLHGGEEVLEDYRPALPIAEYTQELGFVQPYSDSPLDGEPVGEIVYGNLIDKARRYVYITTPYLILDHNMTTRLCTAAKCGIDVRIITPHIADKWYVHAVTRHNYAQLLESGVRIFEYTPGFIHAKSFVVDDEYAVVGTVNLDYRSLYLHFENGVWMYGARSVTQVLEDFIATQKLSQEITIEQCRSVPFARQLGRAVLAVFSPLM